MRAVLFIPQRAQNILAEKLRRAILLRRGRSIPGRGNGLWAAALHGRRQARPLQQAHVARAVADGRRLLPGEAPALQNALHSGRLVHPGGVDIPLAGGKGHKAQAQMPVFLPKGLHGAFRQKGARAVGHGGKVPVLILPVEQPGALHVVFRQPAQHALVFHIGKITLVKHKVQRPFAVFAEIHQGVHLPVSYTHLTLPTT